MSEQPDTLPVSPAPAELPVQPGFFGSNQWIAIGMLVLSYAIATIFVFSGRATAEWWGTFITTLGTAIAGITLGSSAIIKTAQVIRK